MNVIVFRQAPYGTSFAGEGVRALSALLAFGISTAVLFMDDGVFVLVKGQDPSVLDMKSIGEGVRMLKENGLDRVLVCRESLKERGIDEKDLLDTTLAVVDKKEVSRLLRSCDSVLTF
ncbi:MAG: sulfurtransferase complex subunit TusC [Theionarchaea archaeon]|nr:sulfurtransferase complex subunit TusC [Theionarchaea archaeon]MBU6999265.1 sulfurtransferase complex subunit TusC [Theionarchaea archaeon]MBU7019610.1 sulfurtransferase complex subunit TusC [Theionarchaea archaeon]MBU7033789.1 sulfurtransferase complex subunit TusC [Theionarchaea archaeon]MBU7040199.1 sulfurtransferase complex subunit TusC [Theionarchaea archaeon]